ncbi:MAG: hypothetical protein Q9219_007649 [cf. Caloplaca sp. 3 TL-2023]
MKYLESRTVLYIDARYIPSEPSVKLDAINTVAAGYARASVIVVLESTLRRIEYDESSKTVALLELAISTWNRRLWTLQEALLAQNSLFVLIDRMIADHEILHHAEIHLKTEVSPVDAQDQCGLHLLKNLLKDNTSLAVRQMSEYLQWRECMVPEDEHLARASLAKFQSNL